MHNIPLLNTTLKYLMMRFLSLATLLISVCTHAEEASFPCNKATSIVELRICNSPYATLKKLDRQLSTWYKRALGATQDVQALRADQREWLLSLETCLTSETIEAHSFVCDRFHDTKENIQCLRDFCLVKKYIDRTKLLNSMATQGLAGSYVLTNKWPNGIHENMNTMAPEDKKFCKSVETALWSFGPLSTPLTVGTPISTLLTKASTSWITVAKPELLLSAIKLEKILRSRQRPETVDSKEFSSWLMARIESGELTISRSITPAFQNARVASENKNIEILRYQRWGDGKQTTNLDCCSRVEFFRVENGDLSTAQSIVFAEDKNTFQFNQKLYFDSVEESSFNDNWEDLPNPQSQIYIYEVYWYEPTQIHLIKMCRLRYEQRSAK